MKLLVITQAVDTEHTILAFFHRWLEEFARHAKHVHVIALEAGHYDLPKNVTVHSLGKEDGAGKLAYLWRFYKLIWQLRKEYDSVFVHMNQVYVILGAPFWRALGKKVGLWYTHGAVSFSLKVAEKLTNLIFTASKESCKLKSNKIMVTGHGIDTSRFKAQTESRKNLDLITVGRITRSKDLITMVECLAEVRKVKDVTLTFVGQALTEDEKAYEVELKNRITELELQYSVKFTGRLSQVELPAYLNEAKVFITTAQNGSLDKAFLEAMACGLPVVSMAPGSRSLPLGKDQVNTKEGFVKAVLTVLESGSYMRQDHVIHIKKDHSLASLIPRIITKLS